MVRTRVGYSGGTTKDPTYHNLGDHAETIQIDYDPSRISYAQLLEVFWSGHDPSRQSWSAQYRPAVFYHNDEQMRLAVETRDREGTKRKGRVFTLIMPYTVFYLAEDYHQKHRLRREHDLIEEFMLMYPDANDFIHSTAAARVNGYLDGFGTQSALRQEINSLGLSQEGSRKLLAVVSSTNRISSGCAL